PPEVPVCAVDQRTREVTDRGMVALVHDVGRVRVVLAGKRNRVGKGSRWLADREFQGVVRHRLQLGPVSLAPVLQDLDVLGGWRTSVPVSPTQYRRYIRAAGDRHQADGRFARSPDQ